METSTLGSQVSANFLKWTCPIYRESPRGSKKPHQQRECWSQPCHPTKLRWLRCTISPGLCQWSSMSCSWRLDSIGGRCCSVLCHHNTVAFGQFTKGEDCSSQGHVHSSDIFPNHIRPGPNTKILYQNTRIRRLLVRGFKPCEPLLFSHKYGSATVEWHVIDPVERESRESRGALGILS